MTMMAASYSGERGRSRVPGGGGDTSFEINLALKIRHLSMAVCIGTLLLRYEG